MEDWAYGQCLRGAGEGGMTFSTSSSSSSRCRCRCSRALQGPEHQQEMERLCCGDSDQWAAGTEGGGEAGSKWNGIFGHHGIKGLKTKGGEKGSELNY